MVNVQPGSKTHLSSGSQNPIRVAVVSAYPPGVWGEAEYAKQFVNAIAGHPMVESVTVITQRLQAGPHSDPVPPIEERNVTIRRVLRSTGPFRVLNGLLLAIWILKNRPDTVHFFGPLNPALYGGAIGETLIPGFVCARVINAGPIVSLHSVYLRADVESKVVQRVEYGVRFAIARLWILGSISLILRVSKRIFVVSFESNSELLDVIARDYKVERSKIEAERHPPILAGVKEKLPETLASLKATRFVLCPGYFREEKGFDRALNVWARLPTSLWDVKLVIAGPVKDGEAEAYLKRLLKAASTMGLEPRVLIVPGYRSGQELRWLLSHAEFVFLPYAGNQGTSGVAIEALSSGTRVLATDVGVMGKSFRHSNLTLTSLDEDCMLRHIEEILAPSQTPSPDVLPSDSLEFPTFGQLADRAVEVYLRIHQLPLDNLVA